MEKRCQKCRLLKPLVAFSKHIRKPDGLQPWCKECDNARIRTHRWSTIGGVRTGLVTRHGMESRFADVMVARLFDPYERCAICGVPNRILTLHASQGYPFIWGRQRVNRRLTIDHVEPNGKTTPDNTRLLCYPCNSRRGANIRTDDSVLRWVTKQWEKVKSKDELWWLNSSPGVGGKHVNNSIHERIANG